MSDPIIYQDRDMVELSYDTLHRFGIDHQIRMMQEECAELIQAINKFTRNVWNRDRVIEELADVFIIWNQMIVHFGITNVEKKVVEKMMRLHSIIKN